MCSSAHWRFSEKQLFKWARSERDKQWKCILAFADPEDVKLKTEYFKDQCITWAWRLAEIQFKDIMIMLCEQKKESKLEKRK